MRDHSSDYHPNGRIQPGTDAGPPSPLTTLVTEIAAPDLCHLLLISLHRLGMMEDRDKSGSLFLTMFSSDAWQVPLLELTLGRKSLAETLCRAESSEQLCQAYFYDGARLLTKGQVTAAWAEFEKCLSFETDCIERQFAEAEVKAGS